jgi:hypothetical protein
LVHQQFLHPSWASPAHDLDKPRHVQPPHCVPCDREIRVSTQLRRNRQHVLVDCARRRCGEGAEW